MQIRYAENVTPLDISKAESPSTKMLLAMSALGKPIYEGTVPAAVKATRRRRNRAARAARKAARR